MHVEGILYIFFSHTCFVAKERKRTHFPDERNSWKICTRYYDITKDKISIFSDYFALLIWVRGRLFTT